MGYGSGHHIQTRTGCHQAVIPNIVQVWNLRSIIAWLKFETSFKVDLLELFCQSAFRNNRALLCMWKGGRLPYFCQCAFVMNKTIHCRLFLKSTGFYHPTRDLAFWICNMNRGNHYTQVYSSRVANYSQNSVVNKFHYNYCLFWW